MEILEKMDMLLFCKEHLTSPRRYILYFTTLETLPSSMPKIHRLTVRSQKAFESFELGGVYRLMVRNIRIVESDKTDDFNLTEQMYLKLLELRKLRFMDPRMANKLRAKGLPLFHPDQYYTFKETKALLSYYVSMSKKILIRAIEIILYGLGIILPFAAYLWFLSRYMLKLIDDAGSATLADMLNIPVFAVGALPLVIFIMTLLFSCIDQLLLHWNFTRYYVLKRYVLSWCGTRKGFAFSRKEVRLLLIFASISVIFIILTMVVISLLPRLFS